jgi:hypothetical protein
MAKIDILTRQDLRSLAVVGGGLEVLDWTLYDTLPLVNAGTQTVFKFFQQAVGPAGVTLETTNMDLPGQLSNGYRFCIESLRLVPKVQLAAGIPTMTIAAFRDAVATTATGTAVLFIGGRDYLKVPAQSLLGGGFIGFGATAVGAGSLEVVSAYPRTGMRDGVLEYKLVLPSTFQFAVELSYFSGAPTLVAPINLRCELKGKIIRPRQG